MIIGVGIDMIETERIAEKLTKKNGFREKVFSSGEIAFCESMKEKHQHYAARFAAKEAFLKATGMGLTLTHELYEIEIVQTESGKPEIKLNGGALAASIVRGWYKIHVSLTHLKSISSAVVIIENELHS